MATKLAVAVGVLIQSSVIGAFSISSVSIQTVHDRTSDWHGFHRVATQHCHLVVYPRLWTQQGSRRSVSCTSELCLLSRIENDLEPCCNISPHEHDCQHQQRRATRSLTKSTKKTIHRRRLFQSVVISLATLLTSQQQRAHATGLVQFPCKNYEFANTYHFMRAGQNLLEAEDIWSTNPLFLTNQEAALSQLGMDQVKAACKMLKDEGITPSIVRYSLARAAIDTADIVGKELMVGRDRLVPEFNFMDPRAVGKWDMQPLRETEAAAWAMDTEEAGAYGTGGRPPPNEDGTPHETLSDQTVRLRQLISVLETQYSGDTILLIFPDGTGPALLTCLIGGIALNRVHEISFHSAEVRLNLTYDNAKHQMPAEMTDEFKEILELGTKQLALLRSKNPDTILSVQDQRYTEERRKIEEKEARLAAQQKEIQKAVNDERRIKRELEKQSGGEDANAFYVVSGLGLLGASTVLLGRKEDADPTLTLDDAIDGSINEDELKMRSLSLVNKNDADVFELDRSPINGSSGLDASLLPKERERKAAEAMKEYLDADDGATDWIGFLADIVNDDSEDSEYDEGKDDVRL